MRPLLERLGAEGKLQVAGATIYDLPVTQKLYARRAYALAWSDTGVVEQLSAAIDQAWREGMTPEDYHQTMVRGLLEGSLILGSVEHDLLLTDSLVRLAYHYALGKIDPKNYIASWNFERKLPEGDPVELLTEAIEQGQILKLLDTLKPRFPVYQNLVFALEQYRAIDAKGGWQVVPEGPTLHKGDQNPRVILLRRRLFVEGDLQEDATGEADLFDTELELALMGFQGRHRMEVDGIAGLQTLAVMNVPVSERIGQIRVNLERARVLQEIPSDTVLVDIAGFEVSMFRNGRRLLISRAQVGRPYRNTPVFHGQISYLEINPTWTVPPGILRRDVLPAIKLDPEYLQSKNMRVLTMDGAEVDPSSIDWQAYPGRPFPYMIRQDPGPENALGRLKIMFPNEHLVYLHDTPSRSLFNRAERTFSSGCIRVEQIERLAELLLNDPQQWSRAEIDAMIEGQKTRRVSLKNTYPVFLVYWTVHVEDNGEVHFKRDPYGRDPKILKALEHPLIPDPARR